MIAQDRRTHLQHTLQEEELLNGPSPFVGDKGKLRYGAKSAGQHIPEDLGRCGVLSGVVHDQTIKST